MDGDENFVGPHGSLSDLKFVPFVVFEWFNGVIFVDRTVYHYVDFFCQFSECYERNACANPPSLPCCPRDDVVLKSLYTAVENNFERDFPRGALYRYDVERFS